MTGSFKNCPDGEIRHLKGSAKFGYLNSKADAQAVLDAVQSGEAKFLGFTPGEEWPVFEVSGIQGTNVNRGEGYPAQPTNVFYVKGTVHPSIVPYNPNFGHP